MAASANGNGGSSGNGNAEGKTKSGNAVEKGAASDPSKRPLSNYNYDEAVLKVQEWNEALKCKCPLEPIYCVLLIQCSSLASFDKTYIPSSAF